MNEKTYLFQTAGPKDFKESKTKVPWAQQIAHSRYKALRLPQSPSKRRIRTLLFSHQETNCQWSTCMESSMLQAGPCFEDLSSWLERDARQTPWPGYSVLIFPSSTSLTCSESSWYHHPRLPSLSKLPSRSCSHKVTLGNQYCGVLSSTYPLGCLHTCLAMQTSYSTGQGLRIKR